MPTPNDRYPPPRPEWQRALQRGDVALRQAMSGTVRLYEARELIIRAGDEHDHVYRLRRGWVFYVRTADDGRRQIISIGVPGDLVGLSSMMPRSTRMWKTSSDVEDELQWAPTFVER